MNLLLLGRNGQLGRELERCLQPLGVVQACDYPEVDLANPASIQKKVRACHPDVVINASAFTAVDKAESEPELAEAVNSQGTGCLAKEARKLNALFIHYSTDYVFDGKKGSPYREEDTPNPVNVYGSSKLHGEQAIQEAGGDYLILRTSWVYALKIGKTRQIAGSFVDKVLEWSRRQETLRVVTDQVGNPTWCRMLAEITAQMLAGGESQLRAHAGLYHLAGSGFTSRYDWAKAILELDPEKDQQIVKEILPAKTADFPTSAERPLFSALDCRKFQKTFGLKLPDWQTALELAFG